MVDLSERSVVVTGAGRGLGRAYVLALVASGARVVVNDVDADAVDAVVAEARAAGGEAVGVAVAVGDADAAGRLVDRAVSEFGRLDVMVTNAGILRDRVVWKMSDDEFDAVVKVHLRGTFTCVRAAAVQMRAQGDGGRMIVAGSPAGQRGNFGQTNYAASKAGIAAMARTWAMELGRSDITVNAVVPNAATPMTATIPAFEPYVRAFEEHGEPFPAKVRRAAAFGSADDVAGLIVFLASEASASITGQCIGIGGDKLTLWSHPQEIASAFRDGGWSADAIADAWSTTVGAEPQSYGIEIPDLS